MTQASLRPLWALPLAAAIAAAILGANVPAQRRGAQLVDDTFVKLAHLRLASIAEPREGRAVVGLGASLIQHAVRVAPKADAAGRPVRYTSIVRFGRNWDVVPRLEEAIAAHPSLILLEGDVLFYRQKDRLRDLIGFVGKGLDKLTHGEGYATTERDAKRELHITERDYVKDREEAEFVAITLARRARSFRGLDPRIAPLLERARAEGVTIAILDMSANVIPMPVYSPAQLTAIQASLAQLAPTGILVWRFPGPMTADDCAANGHFSRHGAVRYQAWLLEQIAALP